MTTTCPEAGKYECAKIKMKIKTGTVRSIVPEVRKGAHEDYSGVGAFLSCLLLLVGCVSITS